MSYVVRSQVHNSVNLSGATCLYVVRSQVHNSVPEWSDMSMWSVLRFTIVVSGAHLICGPFSGSTSVPEWSDMSICGPFSGSQ